MYVSKRQQYWEMSSGGTRRFARQKRGTRPVSELYRQHLLSFLEDKNHRISRTSTREKKKSVKITITTLSNFRDNLIMFKNIIETQNTVPFGWKYDDNGDVIVFFETIKETIIFKLFWCETISD